VKQDTCVSGACQDNGLSRRRTDVRPIRRVDRATARSLHGHERFVRSQPCLDDGPPVATPRAVHQSGLLRRQRRVLRPTASSPRRRPAAIHRTAPAITPTTAPRTDGSCDPNYPAPGLSAVTPEGPVHQSGLLARRRRLHRQRLQNRDDRCGDPSSGPCDGADPVREPMARAIRITPRPPRPARRRRGVHQPGLLRRHRPLPRQRLQAGDDGLRRSLEWTVRRRGSLHRHRRVLRSRTTHRPPRLVVMPKGRAPTRTTAMGPASATTTASSPRRRPAAIHRTAHAITPITAPAPNGSCDPNYAGAGTNCGDAEGACTNQDRCDGVGACTDNGFKPATTACGDPSSDPCDGADHCTGTDGSCDPNHASTTTTCGDARRGVHQPDYCDGNPASATNTLQAGDDGLRRSLEWTVRRRGSLHRHDGSCDPNHATATTTCGDAKGRAPTRTTAMGPASATTTASSPRRRPAAIHRTAHAITPITAPAPTAPAIRTTPAPARTAANAEGACTNQDYCDGTGLCHDNGFKPATTACGDPSSDRATARHHCTGTDGSLRSEPRTGHHEPAANAEGACTNQGLLRRAGSATTTALFQSTAATACGRIPRSGPCDSPDQLHPAPRVMRSENHAATTTTCGRR